MRHAFWRGSRHTHACQFEAHHHHHDWAGHGCGPRGACDMPRHGHPGHPGHHGHQHHDDEGAGAFGVRRPLRFLAHKLDLDEKQVTTLARILDELKTERAQAAVDDRRSLAEFADAVSGEVFDAAKAASGGDRRVQTATRMREAVVKALGEIHALLNPDQRERFGYMLRTGILAV